MLIVDTGPLVALLNRKDSDHERCSALLESHNGELLITPYVLTETCYLVQKRLGGAVETNLVEAVAAGEFTLVPAEGRDLARIGQLMRRYQGFPLGITDASVIALAERLKLTEVATLDHRHFRAVVPEHVPALTLLP
ncbi:type II toxin-antitoxin system VapC family toxin [Actinacidiphila acididurans]|uniref:Ribonuclease VapC n=1 Tax=Actinacidiphila acididurans TaxID=2784346 RepID=A0ABS2TNZ0_9ACTN|nr:PIN domain-containing protein [Actinacidiphila acididurans]MBM9504547.1 PIN domain-containing protein [Actinacidiphila acididurans]